MGLVASMTSKLSILIVSAAAMALGACAREAASDNLAPVASDYGWFFHEDAFEGAKLAYGAPESDDVLLMLTCEPGSGQVAMSTIAEQARPAIVLASNGDRDTFDASASESELGGMLIEAHAAVAAPSLARFARTGELSMRTNGDRVSLAASARDREQVSQFFAACGA